MSPGDPGRALLANPPEEEARAALDIEAFMELSRQIRARGDDGTQGEKYVIDPHGPVKAWPDRGILTPSTGCC